MKNNIFIIYPYQFRVFDYTRFEVKCLEQQSKVVIHELIECLHPHFSGAYHTSHSLHNIQRFSSLLKWKKEYLSAVRSCKEKPYVMNFVPIDGFSSLFVNYVISTSNVNLIKYNNSGLPSGINNADFFEKIALKLNFLQKRATFKSFSYEIFSKISQIFGYFLCRCEDYSLTVGKSVKSGSPIKMLKVNSFDYSMFLSYERNRKSDCSQNSIVFLDSGTPLFKTDSLLSGRKVELTIEKWYPALVNFFDWIEGRTGCVVTIAAHPKHKYNNETEKVFCGRKIVHNETIEQVSQSKLVLTVGSTAVSHAVMFKKPIVLLNSNEIKYDNSVTLKHITYLKELLGCQLINIDSYNKDLVVSDEIDQVRYFSYKNKYLTSRSDKKTNCEVILDEIVNRERAI